MHSVPDSVPEVGRILTVCTGNVCRSSYLERRLDYELRSAWKTSDIVVTSAGTQALVGSEMAPPIRQMLQRRQPDERPFSARALTQEMVREASLVITATRHHRTSVNRLDPQSLKKTHALCDLAHLAPHASLPQKESREALTAAQWLLLVVPALARVRGTIPTLPEGRSGIIDPFGRGAAAFEQMQEQIERSLVPVLQVLTAHRDH